MLRKQILTAAIMALVICAAAWFATRASHILTVPLADSVDDAMRLALVCRWMLIPGLCLLAGVASVALRRFFSPDAFDGSRFPQSHSLEINLRYNQNTTEQTILAAIAWACLALKIPPNNLALIPGLAILFGIGRILFWTGYLMAPWARALGFGFSFYPTAVALIWSAAHAIR